MAHVHAQGVHIRVEGFQPVRLLAALIGLVYLAGGIVGFVRTGFGDFTGPSNETVLGFLVNPLSNLMNVVVGVLGLLAASSSASSRTFGWVLFVGFGVVSIWGLMIAGVVASNPVSGLGNPLDLNAADTWLHIGTAALGLIMAIMPARKHAKAVVQTAAGERSDSDPGRPE